MNEMLFKGIFDMEGASVIALPDFLLCISASLLLGLIIAGAYHYNNRTSHSFLSTLALLPAVVCVVIMMVNGNVGTGVAVAGAFSLVRFRSAPGTAREIGALFLAMAAGLLTGMGYIGYAVIFVLIMGIIQMFYTALGFGREKINENQKILRITIPEDLNYEEVFDSIFEEFTKRCELVSVRTANMGSLFRLTYELEMEEKGEEKEMIDQLRTRNGNLEITMSRKEIDTVSEL